MVSAKQDFREWLQHERRVFRPAFRAYEGLGLQKHWSELLSELEDEGFIRDHIAQMLDMVARPDLGTVVREWEPHKYRSMDGTACWVQYYMALSFLAAYQDGIHAKPDLGDQVDFRHATYAGLAHEFVTADERMLTVLRTMVPACKSAVLTFDEFAASLRS